MDPMDFFATAQQELFEAVVQPLMFNTGLGNFLEDGYQATGWLMIGLIQIMVLVFVIGPLQRWKPVEAMSDRSGVRTDILYTLIHRLGLFRLVMFFALDPLFDTASGYLHFVGIQTLNLDDLWPGVTDLPWISLLMYLVVFDFLDYWIHRGQHHFAWWWALHAVHHSQRQMTMWSDNRNHLLDDVIRDSVMAVAAQFIGIAPGQFVAVTAITQLSESLQHANLKMWFGRWGERLWVSPRFHRLHHSISLGHETVDPRSLSSTLANRNKPKTVLGGHNFGVLLPCWDVIFGTANFELRFDPTGIRDQVEPGPSGVRDYGQGLLAQQWLGLRRMLRLE